MSPLPAEHVQAQPRWFWPALVPVVTGVVWLVMGWQTGIFMGLVATVPAIVLLASGTAIFVWPGDLLNSRYMALAAILSLLPCLVALFMIGFVAFIGLLILAGACYLVAGYTALRQSAVADGVPQPQMTLSMAAKAALDEVVLTYFVMSASIPVGADVDRDHRELEQINNLSSQQGWRDDPQTLHTPPAPPEQFNLAQRNAAGRHFRQLSFYSDYVPHPDMPGRHRWLTQQNNRRVHAWIFEHRDRPRPWLLCVHGYRMGTPHIDFSLFDIKLLHETLGLNLAFPILPLHGPRKSGFINGSGYLDGALANIFHAQVQAIRDLRRTLAWIHAQHEVPAVGVLGYSLGGYNAALLASLEDSLTCAIAGIPLTDMPGVLWQHTPKLFLRYFESRGITVNALRETLTPVSPLALAPRVAHDRRYIFAATGDQIVPTWQPQALWQHWDRPACHWYQGSHLSVRREPGIRRFLTSALKDSNLSAPVADPAAAPATGGSTR